MLLIFLYDKRIKPPEICRTVIKMPTLNVRFCERVLMFYKNQITANIAATNY